MVVHLGEPDVFEWEMPQCREDLCFGLAPALEIVEELLEVLFVQDSPALLVRN